MAKRRPTKLKILRMKGKQYAAKVYCAWENSMLGRHLN